MNLWIIKLFSYHKMFKDLIIVYNMNKFFDENFNIFRILFSKKFKQ